MACQAHGTAAAWTGGKRGAIQEPPSAKRFVHRMQSGKERKGERGTVVFTPNPKENQFFKTVLLQCSGVWKMYLHHHLGFSPGKHKPSVFKKYVLIQKQIFFFFKFKCILYTYRKYFNILYMLIKAYRYCTYTHAYIYEHTQMPSQRSQEAPFSHDLLSQSSVHGCTHMVSCSCPCTVWSHILSTVVSH